MKPSINLKQVMVAIFCCHIASCEDYVEVQAPDHKIVSDVVFSSDETALSAMKGIYNQLFRAPFSGGWEYSVTALAGLSADELHYLRTTNLTYVEFEKNEISPSNSSNLSVWSSSYNMIYMANSVLEGIMVSDQLTEEIQLRLEGEAKFVRAFTYFYLTNLYGEIPLLLTTDYRNNAIGSQNSVDEVYQQIISDLEDSIDFLGPGYFDGDRTNVNRFVAMALLARVYLYRQDWEQAEKLSSQVIEQNQTYEILEDLDQVFLMNSREAIWQLSPIGRGNILTNTNEGSIFIIDPIFSFFANFKLSDGFVDSFQARDKRLSHWVGFHEGIDAHYAYKYKDRNSTNNITEYSMVLRFAEQYLIRAEARTMQGDLPGAIEDLDKILGRANLGLMEDLNPSINKEALLDVIMEERKKEFFTEWGHRWFDLKRTGSAAEILGRDNPMWQNTDVLYPIPDEERMKNTNLKQNPGY